MQSELHVIKVRLFFSYHVNHCAKHLILAPMTACSDSYNATRSLESSCHMGCDNQESVRIKNKKMKNEHKSMSSFFLSLPFSSSYKFTWTNSFVEQETANKSVVSPFILLKHTWSKFSANYPFHSFPSFPIAKISKVYDELMNEKEVTTVKSVLETTTVESSDGTTLNAITTASPPKLQRLLAPVMATIKDVDKKNKTIDCIITNSFWPQFYIQASSIQYEGADLTKLCDKPKLGEYIVLVSFLLAFFIIVLVFIQVKL